MILSVTPAGDFDAQRQRGYVEKKHILGSFGAAAEKSWLARPHLQGDDLID